MYLLKLALRPWKMAPVSQLLTAATVGLLIFIMGFLLWVDRGITPLLSRLSSETVLTAYLAPTVNAEQEIEIVDSIRVAVGASAERDGVTIRKVNRENFMKNLEAGYPQLAGQLMDLGNEMSNVVPRYVSVSGLLPEPARKAISAIPGISDVEASDGKMSHLLTAFRAVVWLCRIVMVGLGVAMLTAILHLTRMNAHFLEDTLAMMRLWGGGALETRIPGMISGMLVGLVGGIGALGLWYAVSSSLGGRLRGLSPVLAELKLPAWDAPYFLVGVALAAGSLAAVLSGLTSGRRASRA